MLRLIQGCLMLAVVIGLGSSIQAQEAQTKGPSGDEMEAMMAEMMRYAAPGEHHKNLESLAGNWDFTMRFHMGPDAPWSENTGHSVHQWVLGGRFLQQNIQSPPSKALPMEFEGLGLLGYDNFAEEYVQLWMDNFMTGVITLKGSDDASDKEVTVSGELTKPMGEGQKIKVRWVYKIVNNDQFTFEMWEPDENGVEYLHGQITYTRTR
jgi:hypothetical protein